MNPARLTAVAERAAARYALLLAGFGSVYAQMVQGNAPGADRTRRLAATHAYTLAESYLAEEADHILQGLAEIREGAVGETRAMLGVTEAEPSPDVAAHTDAIAAELENSVRVQIERDVASLTRGLRVAGLRGALSAKAGGLAPHVALARLRGVPGQLVPDFTYMDRAGRRWPSAKYVRTLWRHALVLGWNESALLTMAEHGVSFAEVRHPDADFAEAGTRVSLTEDPQHVSYEQLREDVFHPNSNAWLAPAN